MGHCHRGFRGKGIRRADTGLCGLHGLLQRRETRGGESALPVSAVLSHAEVLSLGVTGPDLHHCLKSGPTWPWIAPPLAHSRAPLQRPTISSFSHVITSFYFTGSLCICSVHMCDLFLVTKRKTFNCIATFVLVMLLFFCMLVQQNSEMPPILAVSKSYPLIFC